MPCFAMLGAHRFLRQRRRHRAVEALDHRRRRPRRREQRRPGIGLDAGHAAFREGRHRSELRHAPALATASARTLPDSICCPIRPGSGAMLRSMRSASSSVSMGERPLNGTCSMSMPALVLNSSPARCAPEPLPIEPKVRAAGLALRHRDHLADACGGEALAHHQHVRHGGDAGDRREIPHCVVGAVLDQALIGGVGLVGAEHQHMAVGLGARHRIGADDARSAGPVLHHDRLIEIAGAASCAISRASASIGPPGG